MKLVFVIVTAAALAGCVNVEKKTDADGSTCQKIELPAFHYTNCTPPGPATPGAPSPAKNG